MDTSVNILLLIAAIIVMIVVAYSRRKALYSDSGPELEPEPESESKPEMGIEFKSELESSMLPDLPKIDPVPDIPLGFGRKNAWLAIKTDDPMKVAESLKLQDLQPANWRTGLTASYEHYATHLFITPPVHGWVFVVGIALPNCGNTYRPDRCTPFIEELGQIYDPVFYFGTHSTIEFHAWARVDKAKVSRAYACFGSFAVWNKGIKTKEEQDLKMDFFTCEPPEGHGEEYWDRKDLEYPEEKDVFKIAEAWSLNPMKLGVMDLTESTGFVGRVPLSWSDNRYKNVLLIQLSKRDCFWRTDFQELSPAEQAFRAVWDLEGEVNNGGFPLYFSISAGDTAFAAVDALRKIGAYNTARIVAEANGIFPDGVPPKDKRQRQAILDSLGTEEYALLQKLSEEFLRCSDNLTELLYEHILQSTKEFKGLADVVSNTALKRMDFIY
ncbi:MAG: DMP19 family protein [Planctomycetes bacterium]|nr:DMP19 family protein [Planctomycetota bacterium]